MKIGVTLRKFSIFFSVLQRQLGDVFDVLGVGEHVDGLDASDLIAFAEELQVAGLGGGVAADVDDFAWRRGEELGDHFLVHAGAWGVGDHYVGSAVGGDEVGGEHLRHVAGVEAGVVEAVEAGVGFGVGDGLLDIFDAYHLAAFVGEEEGYGAGAGVEVVEGVGGLKFSEFGHETVEALRLGGVGLVE